MRQSKDVSEMVGHPYFRDSEERHEPGSGLRLALEEMAARKRRSAELRAQRYEVCGANEDALE
jgi:hypothetical protein